MTRKKRQWFVVLLLLVGAVLMMTALFAEPDWALEVGRTRQQAAGSMGEASRAKATTEPTTEKAPDEDVVLAHPEKVVPELPPYGDKSLSREVSIRGRVIDAEGKPVPDAIVTASYRDTLQRPYAAVTASRVRTESDGTFVLGPLDRRNFSVLAMKSDVGAALIGNQMPGAYVELALAPGAKLRGKITDGESGEPVVGATVVLRDWTMYLSVATDAKGEYQFGPVPPTIHTWSGLAMIVVADGYKPAARTNMILRNKQDDELNFQLTKGATLTGKVLDAQTLQPISGAIVADGWQPYDRDVEAGEDGTYALSDVDTAPNLTFVVRAKGYLPQTRQSDGSGTLNFSLDASIVVSGKVLTLTDQPVPNARVYLHRLKYAPGFQPTGNSRQQWFTTANASGEFEFTDVLPGQVAVIGFGKKQAPGEFGPIQVPTGGPAPEPVTINLKEGVTVEGEVRDLQDNPLPGIRVSLQRGWGRISGYKWATNYIWSEIPTWYTDEKGKFKLEGSMPGQLWLNAWHNTYGWTGTSIKGTEGQRVTDVIISFAGSSISGVFLNADGEPVPGANVQARGPKNTPKPMWRWTQTDGLGRFKLGGLKDGAYDINGWSSMGNPEQLKDIPAGSGAIELKLKRSQTLRGSVTSVLSGRALDRFTVSIQPARKNGRRTRGTSWSGELRTPDGKFDRSVMPGTYAVTVKARGHAPRVFNNIVVEQNIEPQEVFATLEPGGGIKGVIKDAEGKPLRSTWVRASIYRAPGEKPGASDWLLGGGDQSDSEGRYFMEGLAPGTYMIQLNLGSRGSAQAQITVSGTEMAIQNLQLLPTGKIVIRVTDDQGKPLAGVYFQLRDATTSQYRGWVRTSKADGVSVSGPLPMGRVAVTATHAARKYVADKFEVDIPAGDTVTVDVQMRKKDA